MSLVDKLIAALPAGQPGLFNPYRDECEFDSTSNTHISRRDRLASHLDCTPRLICIGEAPGYQGCRYSGIAFTSERLLSEGVIPRVDRITSRLSTRTRPFSEPSATIVWKALYKHGLADQTILWNAVQLHPHIPGKPWTNRTPTKAEILLGAQAIHLLREAFPAAAFVAVGKSAQFSLEQMGIKTSALLRHPANGGATLFNDGLSVLAAQIG